MQPQDSSTTDFSFPASDFLQNSSIVFYQCSLDEDFPIINISKNTGDVLGYAPTDFYKTSTFWVDKIHPEDRPEIHEQFFDIINHQKRSYVYRFQHGNGNYIWLRDENIVHYDEKGNPISITGTAIDITRQKQAEREVKELNKTLEQRIEDRTRNLTMANRKLKKQIQYRNKVEKQVSDQEKRLRLLQVGINHINDMVIISKAPVDDPLNSKIIFTNQAFEKFTGYQSSEVRGKNPNFLHGKKTQPEKVKQLNEGIKNKEQVRVEFINYKKDGSTFWVDLEMTPFPAEEEGMEYWVGVNRDISKRKKAEEALEENKERYQTYAELSFDAIFEIDLDGQIIDCNGRACELFGYSREELLSMNVRELTPEKYIDQLPQELSPEITTEDEVLQRTYKKKDGSTFPSEINTKHYQRDDVDHILAYVRDISDHIEYEKAIEKSLKEKSTLLAEVHHRVKNNLAVISGLLEMQAFNAQIALVQQELKESQSRIQSIATVHELLYQSESFSNIHLEPYIDELVSYISETFGHEDTDIRFEKEIAPVSLTVKQAVPCGLLLNELITNAYKHAFPAHSEGMISIKLTENDGMLSLTVADNGVGLPEDFDYEESSSLGITLIHTLVRQINGSLTIESEPKTKFQINFKMNR